MRKARLRGKSLARTVSSRTKAVRKAAKASGVIRSARKSMPLMGSKRASKYDVLGRTRDGVFILNPKVKATHFTRQQIRQAIIEVENAVSD